MNRRDEQLVADYLAGLNVEHDLKEACERDASLLTYLSQQRSYQRQINHALVGKTNSEFVDSVLADLTAEQRRRSPPVSSSTSNWRVFRPWLAMCASLILALMLFNSVYLNRELGEISKLAAVDGVNNSVYQGQAVHRGRFSLDRGYAELLLSNGVTLVLEAPVVLTLQSAEHILLERGNLVARVPEQAIGFKLDTPSANIVDLGTEFGVSVDQGGQSQVHVLDGEVKVRASKKHDYEYLVKDQARAFDLQQQVARIESQPRKFMRSLPGKSQQRPDYMHWSLNALEKSYFKCDGPGINALCFDAMTKKLSSADVSAELVAGVFDRGLYFNGQDIWLATEFPGIGGNRPRSVAFWVKVPSDFHKNEGFGILSWGLPDFQSAWQVSINPLAVSGPLGRIRIGTNAGEIVGSSDLRDDSWHHIAIVLFGGQDVDLSTHVLIYVDGELEPTFNKSIARIDTRLDHPKSKPLVMGRNIAFDSPKKENKFFRGALDEVYIFDSALDQEAIKSLMLNNKL